VRTEREREREKRVSEPSVEPRNSVQPAPLRPNVGCCLDVEERFDVITGQTATFFLSAEPLSRSCRCASFFAVRPIEDALVCRSPVSSIDTDLKVIDPLVNIFPLFSLSLSW